MKGEDFMSVDGVSFGSVSQSQMQKPQMDPEAYAQQYANQHGISIEQAREELKAQFGDPQQQGGVSSATGASGSNAASTALSTGDVDGTGRQPSIPPEAMQLHQIYGIPLEVIQEGDNAIQQYAKENNITLPQKTQGNSLNLES